MPRLATVLADRRPEAVKDEGANRAAVAVIVSAGDDPAFVLIRRKVREGDPWSGQMAFPGGFRASETEPLEATARRETREETGLDLESDGHLLGTLDDVSPRTPFLPPLVVRPLVFSVDVRAPLVPGEEAEAALWIAARDLFDPAHRFTHTLDFVGGPRAFPAIRLGSHLVWGLTERILHQVSDLIA